MFLLKDKAKNYCYFSSEAKIKVVDTL